MTSPNWEEIGEKYSIGDIENLSKDYSKYFGPNAKNNIHNDLSYSLTRKGKKGDIHKYSIVQHANEVLPGIQKRLIAEHKVVHYTYKGKEIYRGSAKWTDSEENRLRQLTAEDPKMTDRTIGKSIGRSEESVKRKRQKLGINKATDANVSAGMRMFE